MNKSGSVIKVNKIKKEVKKYSSLKRKKDQTVRFVLLGMTLTRVRFGI